jgi:hypothetical protein
MIVGKPLVMPREESKLIRKPFPMVFNRWSIMFIPEDWNLVFTQVCLSFSLTIWRIVDVEDAGYKTCGRRPGSLGYEKIDADTYAEWQVDFLKYDNCFDDGTIPEVRYPVMRDALNQTGRPIFFSLCGKTNQKIEQIDRDRDLIEWGVDSPALWAMDVGNSWRTAGDLEDKWEAMISTMDIVREIPISST